ncbi:hypothetical protein COU89_01305 [Candidatus Roizmanbacteria bacterium CG10_big_fil_rev_8_21_14_0_10_45_7]|uniref:Uncharacterized protein n=1 Tax=Candidatus Roizmanbacteria bacterium CG10_big_fil_rev_8_21_14_0_10_45_7 TaxID=1974854 RepID=A0A2M8KV38_9BACT|nr:MAG: hypothetical protein COU89_01305 [Candidatus Roizmanbacteria bacterium CG10_big_fil_rev_8_21_14_0_10_45_7]
MRKIIFHYNLNKDIDNYINSIYRFKWLKHERKDIDVWTKRFLFPEELKVIQEAENEIAARKILKDILTKITQRNRYEFLIMQQSLEKSWYRKERRFFELTEQFYRKPIFFPQTTAYFTTLPICPYSLKECWFMVSYRFSLEEQVRTICHEIMHFMFLYYYQDTALKEAFTVFLNTDFREIVSIPDRGYPQEKELRNFLFTKRKTTTSFPELLKEGIQFLKT